jgi:ferredoxin
MPTITFKNQNTTFPVPEGMDLLQIAKQNPDIPFKFGCTRGDCGVCAIKILEGNGNLTKLCPKECETLLKKGLKDNYRLACQCAINGSIIIE